MDRFIAASQKYCASCRADLKSNMDRFIENQDYRQN